MIIKSFLNRHTRLDLKGRQTEIILPNRASLEYIRCVSTDHYIISLFFALAICTPPMSALLNTSHEGKNILVNLSFNLDLLVFKNDFIRFF